MKLVKFYTFYFIAFLLFSCATANAQNNGGENTEQDPLEVKIFPPSPNTASLGKYGEVPVGLYTGIPQISIPLTSIQEGSLLMPISLSYHAGGVRVEEIASWVGLGWSLNAGGVITRQVRGIPDELDMNRQNNIDNIQNYINEELLMQEAVLGIRDTESDLYVFNINGISGTFFFGENNEILFTNKQDYKIEKVDNYASAWILTDATGNKYYFGSTKDGSRSAIEFAENYSVGSFPSNNSHSTISAWYITEIEDVTEQDRIEFNYRVEQTTSLYRSGESYARPINSLQCGESNWGYKRYLSVSINDGLVVESIITKHQKVEFVANLEREDLNSMSNGNGTSAKALTNILVKSDRGELIRQFDLSYSYFNTFLNNYPNVYEAESLRAKKLRLDRVQEKNQNTTMPPHIFEYNPLPIPERFSCQMDFWGFYNGKTDNDGVGSNKLIPTLEVSFAPISPLIVKFEGADRTSDEEFMKASILEKIIYPTGGYTEFDYEANRTKDLIKFPIGYQYEYEQKLKRLEVTENPLNPISEQIFEINDIREYGETQAGTFVEWNIENLFCVDGYGTFTCGVSVEIKGISNSSFHYVIQNETGEVYLPNGTYKMVCEIFHDNDLHTNREFNINYRWKEAIPTQEKMAGGLRIKTIKSYTDVTSEPIVKQYEYVDEEGISSGRVVGRIMHIHKFAPIPSCEYGNQGIILKSNSLYPLVNTQGSYVGYQKVTIYEGINKELGKTENVYSFADDILLTGNLNYPFASVSKESFRGHLQNSKVYATNGSTYNLISETINSYNIKFLMTDNLKVAQIFSQPPQVQGLTTPVIDFIKYETISAWNYIQSTTQKTYDPNNSQIIKEQTTNYFYNEDARHTLPIRTETMVDNKTLITHTKYPLDYEGVLAISNPVSQSINYLQDRNIVGTPIETYTTEVDIATNQEKVVSAQRMVYNPTNPYLKEIHQLEANSTAADNQIENFVPSSINAQGEFVSDSRYEKRLEYYKYDEYGNPLEFGKIKDVHKSYIWGYKNTYPIAEVINASQDQIAHTSFEEDGNTAIDARTGKKCFRLQNILSIKEDLPGGKYLFSIWVKGSGTLTALDKIKTFDSPTKWLRIEFRFDTDNLTDINVAGDDFLIDEVRLHPLEAHMITRTYTPLIGVTSETNVNHNSNFYEYDELQRLHIVRDQKGNIIKRNDYEYKED